MLIRPVKVPFLKNLSLTRNDWHKILWMKMTLYLSLVRVSTYKCAEENKTEFAK